MARTALTVINAPTPHATALSEITFAAGDAVNGNEFTSTGREILIARAGATGGTLTVQSAPDPYGREGDIVQVLGANEVFISQVFPMTGWRQSDATIDVDVTAADIELAVVRLPS